MSSNSTWILIIRISSVKEKSIVKTGQKSGSKHTWKAQEEVDDLIGDEAGEAADQEQVQEAIAAANIKAREEDLDPDELEAYVHQRFGNTREFTAGSDFNEQSGEHTVNKIS